MSDHEGPSGVADDELSLPKATVQKLIAGAILIPDATVLVLQANDQSSYHRNPAQRHLELERVSGSYH